MDSVTCLCIVLAEILCFVQAQTFEIKKEFIDGNLTFTWRNVSTRRNDIVITKDESKSGWIQIHDDKYTVEDVWKYKSVTINVREYTSADHQSYKDYNSTYTGTPRLDISAKFQYVYWSTSASDVKLNVVVPVISSALSDDKTFEWVRPAHTTSIIDTVVKQLDDVKYKYRIISTISVTNQNCFGNYTLRYDEHDIVTITINDKDFRDPSSKTDYRLQSIVIGVSVALFIIIVVGTVAVMACVRRKKSNQQQPQQDRISAIITIDDSSQPDQVVVTDNDRPQPDQVQYAVVDRNTLMRNRNQTDKGTDGATKNKNDENDATYAKTEESTLMTKTENKTNDEKATPQGDDEKTNTNNGNTESRTVNQEGLIYIDVAFANKPESSNTNKKSVVHGEEDKTEYTFVDFSKKASSIQEKPDDNNSD
ncbi:uncharacterized protein LOC125648803 [Ostrea edulis]|uniref:uncharacterized protein LOC125648803 n=1 Tax=Ostrea edulis TaxID=37623 RepID=UPI0024AFF5E2|nr:uncharacterized protein LOC125648803 [Ostrea edulis]